MLSIKYQISVKYILGITKLRVFYALTSLPELPGVPFSPFSPLAPFCPSLPSTPFLPSWPGGPWRERVCVCVCERERERESIMCYYISEGSVCITSLTSSFPVINIYHIVLCLYLECKKLQLLVVNTHLWSLESIWSLWSGDALVTLVPRWS